jgi:hypothetical protein
MLHKMLQCSTSICKSIAKKASVLPVSRAASGGAGEKVNVGISPTKVAPTLHGPGKAIRRMVGATLAVALAP